VGRPDFVNFVDRMSFLLIKLVDLTHLKQKHSYTNYLRFSGCQISIDNPNP
jgi:hypothetical protein